MKVEGYEIPDDVVKEFESSLDEDIKNWSEALQKEMEAAEEG
jgi:hypothetical protein